MKRLMFSLGMVTLLVMFVPAMALADSISPASYEATLDVGESVTITKTVTIDDAPPTSAKVDVFFLFDTTGSMGDLIESAKTEAANILSNISGLGDVAFGVGHYEDFPVSPYGGSSDTPFELVQDLTTDASAADAAINSLALGSGADGPESNLYALSEVASTTSWRADSTRIVVWFGDCPGHDKDVEPAYPGVGLADSIAALNAENIIVEAVDVSPYPSSYGLDLWSDPALSGQATAITDATDGDLFSMADTSGIVDVVSEAVIGAFEEYHTVTLDVSGVPAGVDVSVAPTEYTGDYSREVTETFEFEVTFTGVEAGTYDFMIHALADGGLVAREADHIVVTDPIPEPGTFLLLGTGLLAIGFANRRFRRK